MKIVETMEKLYALYSEEEKSFYNGSCDNLVREESKFPDIKFFTDLKSTISERNNIIDYFNNDCDWTKKYYFEEFLNLKIVEFTPKILKEDEHTNNS